MRRIITILLLSIVWMTNAHAAKWTKLQENKHARLMLDKQSMTESGKYEKAWVKIKYKTLQTNIQYPEKSYNNAKLLWYFNCAAQQSATAQVYQLLNDELVFSAAIDIKRARFLEPVPETEADTAMHYVCKQKAYKEAAKAKKARATEAEKNKPVIVPAPGKSPDKAPAPAPVDAKLTAVESEKKAESSKESNAEEAPEKADKTKSEKDKATKEGKHDKDEGDAKKRAKESGKGNKHEADDQHASDQKKTVKRKKRVASWKYEGKKGPEFWGDLSPDFATCKAGSNQSPIDINKTMVTTLNPLKTFQRFPVADMVNHGHTIQANFKPGNILVVDGVMYQMKHVNFHAPSENQIMGKSFPLEAHFVHADPKGHLAILAVMFDEGQENKALAKLWKQLPKRKGKPEKVAGKVLAGDLLPRKKEYYRFSGSLTTPPCKEGVVWVVMKTAMTVSKQQIDALKKIIRKDNNRPIQALNGRVVVE